MRVGGSQVEIISVHIFGVYPIGHELSSSDFPLHEFTSGLGHVRGTWPHDKFEGTGDGLAVLNKRIDGVHRDDPILFCIDPERGIAGVLSIDASLTHLVGLVAPVVPSAQWI